MVGRIQPTAPFDFDLCFRLLCSPPLAAEHPDWAPCPDYWHRREYRRVVTWTGQPALLRLKSCGLVDRPEIEWRLEFTPPAADIPARVSALVSAPTDLAACYASFAADPVLAGLAARFPGLRVIRFPSLYECLLSTVLEQQLNFHFAARVKRQLAHARGPALEFDGQIYHGCPQPAQLARLSPEALRPLQISAPKARALIAIARAALAGELDESRFLALDAGAAAERLQQLRGVGRWTAEVALLRGLGHPDALPADDVGLQKTVGQLYQLRSPLTPLAFRRRWRKLAPWRGYAAYYTLATQWRH